MGPFARTKLTGKRSASWLTAACFVENAAAQSILQQMQLGLVHRWLTTTGSGTATSPARGLKAARTD